MQCQIRINMLITLRQMQYVLAVDEQKSFSKAAKLFDVDQSTLSQQIKLFEARLGVEIFDRSYKPLLTTPEGRKVINKIKEIIEKVEQLIGPFKAAQQQPVTLPSPSSDTK